MMNRHMQTLELDKILELLAQETGGEDAAAAARALEPATTLAHAQELLDETGAAYHLMAQCGSPSFGQAKNVNNALRRAQAGACLSLRELLDVSETLRVIRSLSAWHEHAAGVHTCLDDRFSVLVPNKYLEDKINTAILSEEELSDNASPTLHDIRRKMRSAAARVRELLDKMIRSAAYQKLLQDPIVTIRNGRFVVPVKAEHRSEIPGLVHDTSASGATVFVEPMGAVDANNEIKVLSSKEEAEIERILRALSEEVGNFADGIIADYAVLIELNVIFAKAKLGYRMKAVMPTLCDDGHLLLRHARHPLLDPKTVVPVDVELGGDFDTLVITGPNTGGKTVTLKTIGLLTLMAMCGMMPPVSDGSRFCVFSSLLADIGDEQSIEQSLSTFSAHMTNIIRILAAAKGRCLVLLDELGAGTDPVEGAALAMAILEQLRAQGARVAATTHYAELKAYAIHTPGVENGSCEFDVATLCPTYRLLVGVPGRSNAFAISERLGMNKALVDRARELVTGDNRRMEDVVNRLEQRRQELESQLRETRELRTHAEQAKQRTEEQQREIETMREQELDKARAQAREIVERARIQTADLIEELDALRKQKTTALQAGDAKSKLRARLQALEETIDPVTKKRTQTYALPRPLKVGDEVQLLDIDKRACVLSLPDAGGNVEVQAGSIRTRVPLGNVRLLEGKAAKKAASVVHVPSLGGRTVKNELDLRGLAADEGVLEMDRFLDDAVICGLQQVTVIHGKGTGVLRSAIHQHLKGHPHVKSYRLGKYGEGETGVTIVELRE